MPVSFKKCIHRKQQDCSPVSKTLPCVVVLVLASCRAKTQDPGPKVCCSTWFPSQSQGQISRSTNGKTVRATLCYSKQQNNGCTVPSLSLGKRAFMSSRKHRSFPVRSVKRMSRGQCCAVPGREDTSCIIVYRPASTHGFQGQGYFQPSGHLSTWRKESRS